MSVKKYYAFKKQVSTDSGVTWSDVTPLELTPSGNSIGTYNTLKECEEDITDTRYFTIIPLEASSYQLYYSEGTAYYSLDSGVTWSNASGGTPTVPAGQKIMWKGSGLLYTGMAPIAGGIGRFKHSPSTAKYNVEGNITSLIYGDNFYGQSTITNQTQTPGTFMWLFGYFDTGSLNSAEGLTLPNDVTRRCYDHTFTATALAPTGLPKLPAATLEEDCYTSMFSACQNLTTLPSDLLPATTLAYACYSSMFQYCDSLTTLPSGLLPAATMATSCYVSMFDDCKNLTTVPTDLLPATSLAYACYSGMFWGCTSLTTAPELPATTLAEGCYGSMFEGCTSLTTAPELPAATLAEECYREMFKGCTSLTTAPELSAATLATGCYQTMFSGCTSLTIAPELPAATLAEECYREMFKGCRGLTTAPELLASTLATGCYQSMFQSCTSLNYIKCLATNISATNCTTSWVTGVASSGTFVKNANATNWAIGANNGIPYGWTVQNA